MTYKWWQSLTFDSNVKCLFCFSFSQEVTELWDWALDQVDTEPQEPTVHQA